MSVIRTFLLENEIEFPQLFWRHLGKRIKGNGARTQDAVPKNDELKRILLNMPQIGRALFLTLASSGMRIGEALTVEIDDVHLDEKPPRIVQLGVK